MRHTRPLLLASGSPRRSEILRGLGLTFSVAPADIDETPHDTESALLYVARLAEGKARAVGQRVEGPAFVLAADTTVVADGELLGKPVDAADSERMLRRLRGSDHMVHTAVAILRAPEQEARIVTASTRVRFRDFSDGTLLRYVASGEGMDKAGSYGIQSMGAALVAEIHGSYSNVVGLPAAETIELLEATGALEQWP